MVQFNDVRKSRPVYCQKVLPAVYDDSLSYYEVICKLQSKLNELIEEFNKLTPDEWATHDELAAAIAELSREIYAAIAELKTYVDNENAEQTVMLKAHLLIKLKELREYLEGLIANTQLSDVKVIDPEDSYPRKDVQSVFYSQNQNYRFFSDSAKNIDAKDYDITTLEGLGLEAYVFDFYSTFYYSMGNLPIDGVYDGNYLLDRLAAMLGGNDPATGDYVKKHDILAYYFQRKE